MKLCEHHPKRCGICVPCKQNERNRIKQNERNRIIREFYNQNKKSEINSLDRLFKEFNRNKLK